MILKHGKAPLFFLMLFLLSVLLATVAAAADAPPPAVDAGDTAWVLISSALVLFMTLGLAFFYRGLVRRKNILMKRNHRIKYLLLWEVYSSALDLAAATAKKLNLLPLSQKCL